MPKTAVVTVLREKNELADGWRGQAGVVCPRCGTEIVYTVTTQLSGRGVSLEGVGLVFEEVVGGSDG